MVTNARILIVDDDPVITMLIGDLLLIEGYKVQTARSPKQALELLSQRRFDLVLLDLVYAEGDGQDLLSAIRSDPLHQTVPVLLISGSADRAQSIPGKWVSGWVRKPFRMKELLERVHRALSEREAAPGFAA